MLQQRERAAAGADEHEPGAHDLGGLPDERGARWSFHVPSFWRFSQVTWWFVWTRRAATLQVAEQVAS